jgi:ParB-like chromosome segregation protein Spo0J
MKSWPASNQQSRPLRSLAPYARNARIHTPDQVSKIAASMKQFGWTMPVLIDEAGEIIAGHGRVLGAEANGWGEELVPVIVAEGWTEDQKRAYRIADNKLSLSSSWDEEALRLEMVALDASGFDLALTGFEAGEIDLAAPAGAFPPDQFPAFGEDIETEHKCPRCSYTWSGKAS